VTDFYDVGALGKVAINLFHGYGYNFYREENQLRADDQKVRTLVCELLSRARKAVSAAEGTFRRERIPPPTRDNPFPPADIVADAKRLEALAMSIGSIEGQVRHAPVPENDRMTQRYREEGDTLLALIEKDKLLVGQAETLRAMVSDKTPAELLAQLSGIDEGISATTQTLAERRILIL
jgi:hypothetical protein